jgi:CxxC-x17-CxxC domain-containing protein
MEFEDKTITCVDCAAEFVHSAADQARYAERGLGHEPKRCPGCRAKRRNRQEGGGGGGGSGQERSGNSAAPTRRTTGRFFSASSDTRGRRESFPATCAACGKETTVPFKPVEGRPVYCRDCFQKQGAR